MNQPPSRKPLPDPRQNREEDERQIRRRMQENQAAQQQSKRKVGIGLFRFGTMRLIFILLVIIVILILLISMFGLGSGGGKLLPGSGGSSGSQSGKTTVDDPVKPVPPADTPKEDEPEKKQVRRELSITFIPSKSDPMTAQEMSCYYSWTDLATGSREIRQIAEQNMADFEFALEKAIRAWLLSVQSNSNIDVPVVAVTMTPFPGEGVFRKIETLCKQIDSRISILRLETPGQSGQ